MTETAPDRASWLAANHRYLCGELDRLRLLLRRRALWLRTQWAQDGDVESRGFAISDEQADRLLAAADGPAEERFYSADAEALSLAASIETCERDLERQRAVLREARAPAALDVLAELFDLSGFERDVVLLGLAPDLDVSFERLYGYVQDDATRRRPTPHLALALFTHDESERAAAWRSLQSDGALRRFHLLTAEGEGLGSAPLSVPERVSGYLLGHNRLDERVASVLAPTPSAPLSGRHAEMAEGLGRWVEPLLRQGRWPRLHLVGPAGSGRCAVARALCSRLGLDLFTLDLGRLASAGPDLPRLLERESALLQLALHVDAGEVEGPAGTRLLDDLLNRLHLLAIVTGASPLASRSGLLQLRVPRPTAEEQVGLWVQVLATMPHSVDGAVEAVAQQFDLGPTLIVHAARQAQAMARLREAEDDAVTSEDLWLACRGVAMSGMDGQAQRIEPSHGWDDIVLPADVRQQLEEIASQVAHRHRVYASWGFGAKLSRGRGITALFAGPSGTGKTLAAEILARHLGLELYRIDLSCVVSKYIGETEKNLRRVFDAAEQSGAILFFDEADALFGKRTEIRDSHDRYANIEIDYLLQRMEEYRGLAILATNMKSHLDAAFLRRLRFLVDFPFPDAEHRHGIWQKTIPAGAPLADLRFDLLSRLEITGGNIQNIVLNAAFAAAGEEKPIGMRHVMRAAGREYAKEEKLVTEAEFGEYYAEVRR